MKLVGAAAVTFVLAMSAALAAQTPSQSRPLMAEQVFKNVSIAGGLLALVLLDTSRPAWLFPAG